MRKVAIVAALLLSACRGQTEYGECVGLGDKHQDKTLVYDLDTRNAIVTAFFVETFVVPVVWALDYAYCPIGLATEKGK